MKSLHQQLVRASVRGTVGSAESDFKVHMHQSDFSVHMHPPSTHVQLPLEESFYLIKFALAIVCRYMSEETCVAHPLEWLRGLIGG